MLTEVKTIPLTQGKVAIVDAEDYERLSRYGWYAQRHPSGHWYAARYEYSEGRRGLVLMHRDIMGYGPGDPDVDHRDGDGLNNRRGNLRGATHTQNMRNRQKHARATSAYKGVWRERSKNKWRAGVKVNGRTIHLGSFHSETDAARAYDAAARELHGGFARLNFPETAPRLTA